MIKNLNKQKLFTIALSVIFTMIFVYMGVKAVGSRLESTYLLVDGSGNFNGGLDVNGGINVPNINNKKFTVDSSGSSTFSGNLTVNGKIFGNGVEIFSGNAFCGDNGLIANSSFCTPSCYNSDNNCNPNVPPDGASFIYLKCGSGPIVSIKDEAPMVGYYSYSSISGTVVDNHLIYSCAKTSGNYCTGQYSCPRTKLGELTD